MSPVLATEAEVLTFNQNILLLIVEVKRSFIRSNCLIPLAQGFVDLPQQFVCGCISLLDHQKF